MDATLKREQRSIELFAARHELSPQDTLHLDFIKKENEDKVLEFIRPFIKTQTFKRYPHDLGYLESRVYLPYVRNEVVKNQEKLAKVCRESYRKYYDFYTKVEKYNQLPWYKRMLRKV